jgi:Ca2+:H+ antiporter
MVLDLKQSSKKKEKEQKVKGLPTKFDGKIEIIQVKDQVFQRMGIGKFFYSMLIFIPISLYFALFTNNHTIVFITTILAIIPLARIMGYSTNEISLQSNPTIGGLVSATFGNIIELIIAIIALKHGLVMVVQASIIGSIIGNILLLIGLSIFVGGLKFKHQKFNKEAIGVSSTMLIIAVVGLAIPSFYAFAKPDATNISALSDAVAIVLALIYIAGLIFSLLTHKDLFDASDEIKATKEKPNISRRTAMLILLLCTVIVAIESEFLVKGIEEAAFHIGLTQTFIGVVVIAIITNIAEKSTAVNFALENKLNLSLEIGLSSAIQIALFVVPILVFVSQIMGYGFSLVFPIFQIVSMVLAVMIVNHLAADGRCNWLEGAQLLSVYLIITIVFFFI